MVKVPIDAVQRLNRLIELSEDPKVVNEDGTQINPFVDFTSEVMDKPKWTVSVEDLRSVASEVDKLRDRQTHYGSPFSRPSSN